MCVCVWTYMGFYNCECGSQTIAQVSMFALPLCLDRVSLLFAAAYSKLAGSGASGNFPGSTSHLAMGTPGS